ILSHSEAADERDEGAGGADRPVCGDGSRQSAGRFLRGCERVRAGGASRDAAVRGDGIAGAGAARGRPGAERRGSGPGLEAGVRKREKEKETPPPLAGGGWGGSCVQ